MSYLVLAALVIVGGALIYWLTGVVIRWFERRRYPLVSWDGRDDLSDVTWEWPAWPERGDR